MLKKVVAMALVFCFICTVPALAGDRIQDQLRKRDGSCNDCTCLASLQIRDRLQLHDGSCKT
jgi:hypothetical protein